MLKVIQTELEEILILEYKKNFETRGSSYSNFSKKEFQKIGLNIDFIEENVYCAEKAGTLYGIHFQNNPMAQTKLLYCVKGRGIDFAVDLRKDSKNYKKWVCTELSEVNSKQIYIPKGFGHAFLSLEDNTHVVMKIDNYFDKRYKREVAWNDPDLNIEFPVDNPILAKHDIQAPYLKDSDCNL